jgi:hypothetical protein
MSNWLEKSIVSHINHTNDCFLRTDIIFKYHGFLQK